MLQKTRQIACLRYGNKFNSCRCADQALAQSTPVRKPKPTERCHAPHEPPFRTSETSIHSISTFLSPGIRRSTSSRKQARLYIACRADNQSQVSFLQFAMPTCSDIVDRGLLLELRPWQLLSLRNTASFTKVWHCHEQPSLLLLPCD